MKILLINNYHYIRGGSERAYFDMAKILTERGHEVAFFSMNHPLNLPTKWSKYFIDYTEYYDKKLSWLEKIIIAFNIWYNWQAARNLHALLKEFKPDIAHLHNIYHHLSPSVVDVLAKEKIPMVMTLHDYKLISPNHKLLVRGKIWEASKPDKYYRCFTDKCVDNSYLQSLVCVIEAYLHKFLKVYQKINLFISPSQFLLEKFRDFGFKKEIIYLPNPFLSEDKTLENNQSGENYLLYYGRLSEEKGIDDLLRAYAKLKTEVKLKIVGAGPQEAELKDIVVREKISGVEFLGYRHGADLEAQVGGAAAIIVPSRWYENAPYSVIEAMAAGKIVVAARIGGLTELIKDGEDGFLFASGDIVDLAAKLENILAHPEFKESIGSAAKLTIKVKNDSEKFANILLETYKQVKKL
jgi:glycosyltransferase involved in cell wall biosynthesis